MNEIILHPIRKDPLYHYNYTSDMNILRLVDCVPVVGEMWAKGSNDTKMRYCILRNYWYWYDPITDKLTSEK